MSRLPLNLLPPLAIDGNLHSAYTIFANAHEARPSPSLPFFSPPSEAPPVPDPRPHPQSGQPLAPLRRAAPRPLPTSPLPHATPGLKASQDEKRFLLVVPAAEVAG